MSPPLPSPWSPHWRSLHPACNDGAMLDALKDHLERRPAEELQGGAIVSLRIFKQGDSCFRLPDGRLCHWGHVPKAASLSIEAAICDHLPHLWRGAHKAWALPPGQKAAPASIITALSPAGPAHVFVPRANGTIGRGRHRPQMILPDLEDEFLPLATPNGDLVYPCILVNHAAHTAKPPGYHALYGKAFRPWPQAALRFCVLREPMERFVSAIAFLRKPHRPLAKMSPQESVQWGIGELEMSPQQRRARSASLDMHLRPQSWYLGREPSYYTHIFRMGEWERLEQLLSDGIGAPVRLPHHNPSSNKERIQLTPSQRRRVEAFYAEDYAHWGQYFGAARRAVRLPWSPRWRSLHPRRTDDEILDALKEHLERTRPPQLTKDGGAIASLQIFKQSSSCFRLPDGRLCHWAQAPKNASISIEVAICKHLPHLWRGAHKEWTLPAGQARHHGCYIYLKANQLPLSLSAILRRQSKNQLAVYYRESGRVWDVRQLVLLVNKQNQTEKPSFLHALGIEVFQPYAQTAIRFCLVREPAERFCSGVGHLRFRHAKLQARNLQESTELALEELERASEGSGKMPDVHLQQQSIFLGREPSYYTHIFRWGEWKPLSDFLSDLVGAPVQLPHDNRRSDQEHVSLTPSQKRRVEAVCAEDYAHWSQYF